MEKSNYVIYYLVKQNIIDFKYISQEVVNLFKCWEIVIGFYSGHMIQKCNHDVNVFYS